MEYQQQFLNALRNKIKNKDNIRSCLWSFSYSHLILKISFVNENAINEKEILDIVNNEMKLPTFVRLMNLNFKKEISTKYVDNELRILGSVNETVNTRMGK